LQKLLEKYPGKIYYVYRHLPLDSIHQEARDAGEASECAADQGKFWPYHDVIFDNTRRLKPEHLEEYAKKLKLNTRTFNKCFRGKKYAKRVQQDIEDAHSIGITGTPGFLIGPVGKDGKVEGDVITGAQPLANFSRIVDKYLGK